MKKFFTFILALVASMCSLTAWAVSEYIPLTALNGTGGTGNEGYSKLVDGNYDSKWLQSFRNGESAWIIIKAAKAVVPESYLLCTGNDTGSYPKRNWKKWNIYAGNFASDADAVRDSEGWVLVDERTDESLPATSKQKIYFDFNQADGATAYQYFMIEVLGTVDAESYYQYPQMDEWCLTDREDAVSKLNIVLEMARPYAAAGLDISAYETLYANAQSATLAELDAATRELYSIIRMSIGYKAPYWNEYPIYWTTTYGNTGVYNRSDYDSWTLSNSSTDIYGNNDSYSSGEFFYTYFKPEYGNRTLSATVNVDELSTFVYSTSDYGGGQDYFDGKIQVYVDDKLVRTLEGYQLRSYPNSRTYARFFEVLQPGTHTIKWVPIAKSCYLCIRNAGVVKSPLITVSLLEPGSLGTEVLYNTDHVKNVRRLKVKGKMNSDDWAKVKMMSGLLDLDLSEAEFSEIPERQFQVTSSDTVSEFLHRIVLPEGLTKINDYAFYYSFLDAIAFPSTLQSIGGAAFNGSHIQEIDMPDDCIVPESKTSAFAYMYWLSKMKCAKNWTVIPVRTFEYCRYLKNLTLPEKLKTIKSWAFSNDQNLTVNLPEGLRQIEERAFINCYNATFSALPESLEGIGVYAFEKCYGLVNLVVPKNVTSIGGYAFLNCDSMKTAVIGNAVSTLGENAFDNCDNLEEVELGISQFQLSNKLFLSCPNLKTLRLDAPSVAKVTDDSNYYPVQAARLKDVDLIVPSFMVNAYKLDKYWYNFKSITGFNSSEIQDWYINNPLVLNHERIDGTPNITINGDYNRMPSIKINGTDPQVINNLNIGSWYSTYSWSTSDKRYNNNYAGQIFSNGNNVSVIGDVEVSLYTPAKTWRFFSLPFDVRVSDITHSAEDVQYKIGYYDGAERALYGTNGSWKDVKGKPVTDTDGLDVTTEYTETSGNYSRVNNKYRVIGTSFAIGENDEVSDGYSYINNEYYVRMNTYKDDQIKIRVNEGYKITRLAITAWSNNSDPRTITLNGAYIDGSFTSVLAENVTFPCGSNNRTTASLEGIEATKLIRLTFDNSLVEGYTRQIYAKIDVTYKQVVPEADEGMAVIPAGTGFIMQTNKDTYNYFHAVDNAKKQNLVSNQEFVKTLEVCPSEKKANTGWNLIGNPWQCFYNAHCLNFTAPITVWDASNSKYVAYSITDDDYAIRPNEAFFVQCPNEEYNTIGFPQQGRQLTSVIESQNAAPAKSSAQNERRLIDVVLTASDNSNDNTRVVLNEKAKLDYEMTCDASKFMSMDNTVPQLFTLDAECTQYAINERPMYDGIVKMGLYVAKSGRYTISIGRCDMEKVLLIDYETGETIDISYGEYSFSTDAGTFMDRFELVFDAGDDPNGIATIDHSSLNSEQPVYDLQGRKVANGQSSMFNVPSRKGIYIVNGKKVIK